MTDAGLASQALEQEVLSKLRRHGIVIWLDAGSSYNSFVDALCARHTQGEFPFPVARFRGSFLELLFELDPLGDGLEKQPLLVHMPGFNEQTIRKTPVLEMYEAGSQFEKALHTLIREAATGRVAPAQVEDFVVQKPTLQQADVWLGSAMSQSTFGLAAALNEFGPNLLSEALAQEGGTLAQRVTAPEEATVLKTYLQTLTGIDEGWVAFVDGAGQRQLLDRILTALAAWILCVEYVHDLRRPPHLPQLQGMRNLSKPVVAACRDLVAQLRRNHAEAYVRIATEVESFLDQELKVMKPSDLGQIDTFKAEETCVFDGAVEALRQGEWQKAKAWCESRQGEKSFWLQRDQLRRWAWNLVEEAALFGETLAKHPRPFANVQSLEHAAQHYAAQAFEVDRAHRRFEQRRLALLESRLPHYTELREVTTALRKLHRAWADELTQDFTALCSEHGFLPPSSLQQRTLFEQVVYPLTLASEKVAVFLIDAFRFEMATELVEELKSLGAVVDLKPRLAELPSITSVGMNVLAPVAQGEKLAVAGIFHGFKTGEYTVSRPEDRARAMGMRASAKPALLLNLDAVCQAQTAALIKTVKSHPLVVVQSREIDDAGEANVGLPTFESTLRQIKAAWHHLQLAGVRNFVFTADHGFLLQDETTVQKTFGTKSTPKRRHILDEHPRTEPGLVHVSVASLGYEGVPGYLLFRNDTAVFETGTLGASFVHGGNSPQERIIPVLTVTHKHMAKGGFSQYAVEVEPLPDVVGLHRMRVRVGFAKDTTTSLGFAAARAIELAVRVPDSQEVQVVIKDVASPGELKTGRVKVPVGAAWTEVFFGLEGPADDRVRVEVHHPDSVERVQSAVAQAWYTVSGTVARLPSSSSATTETWMDSIVDEGIRKVFLHIEKHGVVTEPEVTKLLGSPRAFRRFSLEFETHLQKLPFRIRIETGEGGKRYVKEGDR